MEKLFKDFIEQKKLYVEAMVEKDYMKIHQTALLKNEFVLKLGEPRFELHKIEIDIAQKKLKLDMMLACIKFNIPLDLDVIDRQLKKDFEGHQLMLRNMKREIDSVHNSNIGGIITPDYSQELKELYFSIASYIHPDFQADSDKFAKRNWRAAKRAYEKMDTVKLRRILKKVQEEYTNTAESGIEDESNLRRSILSMKRKTKKLISEMENMKKQFPFNEAKMLQDTNAVNKYKKDIDIDIKIAKEVLDKLEKQILENLPAQGKYLN